MSNRDDGRSLPTGVLRWTARTVGFTIGACLLVAASAIFLFVVVEHGGRVVAAERTRSLLALGLFVALIGISAYLLAVSS